MHLIRAGLVTTGALIPHTSIVPCEGFSLGVFLTCSPNTSSVDLRMSADAAVRSAAIRAPVLQASTVSMERDARRSMHSDHDQE